MDSRRVEWRGRGESPAELRRRPTKDELPVKIWWWPEAEKGSRMAVLIWEIGLKEPTLVWKVGENELTGDDDVWNLIFWVIGDLGSSRECEWRRRGRPPDVCRLEIPAYGKWLKKGRGLLKILWVSEMDERLKFTEFRNGDLEMFAS